MYSRQLGELKEFEELKESKELRARKRVSWRNGETGIRVKSMMNSDLTFDFYLLTWCIFVAEV